MIKSHNITYNWKKKAGTIALVIIIANFFRNLGMSIVDIGLPGFILSLAGDLTSYGIVIGIFSITQSLLQFPMAALSDKYGRKTMVLIGISVYIAGTFLCYTAQNVVELIIFRAIQGAGAYSSILQAMMGDLYGKDAHGKAMAYYSFALSLGYFGGIVVGGYISYYLGFRMIFLISGFTALFSAILLVVFLKDIERKPEENLQDGTTSVIPEQGLKRLRILLREGQFKIAVLLNSIRWFLFGGLVVYLIWLLEIYWGLDEIQTSYLLLIIVAIYITHVILSGKFSDKFGVKKIMLLGQIIIVGFGMLYVFVYLLQSLVLFVIASFFIGIGFAFYQTAGNTFLLKVIEGRDSKLKGTGFGFNNAVGFFCGALGPIALSVLGEISEFYPFFLITVMVGIALIISLIKVEEI